MGVLYSRLNKDKEEQQKQLDAGMEVFISIKERLVALETNCENCDDVDKKEAAEIQRIATELGRLHDDVIRLVERHHREDARGVSYGGSNPQS